jgi:predicted 3-demethylubiquinone-9 3-methyltransferase (glyoxalase superfamily)
MQKINPCLWFDKQAEDAVKFYTSVFKNSKILKTSHYTESASKGAGMPKGTVMTVDFEIEGQRYMALNGGPHFKFSPAVSLVVNCETQEEIDYYWEKLTSGGGETGQCGWLQDKFGFSWQIVPRVLAELVSDDAVKADRVMGAVMGMKKLDLQALKKAYEG